MSDRLSQYPGMDLNFSQNIQDNVEEAMSGVKGGRTRSSSLGTTSTR